MKLIKKYLGRLFYFILGLIGMIITAILSIVANILVERFFNWCW